MKNILIFYEHVVREYESCIKLKEELGKNKNYNVKVFSLQYQILECLNYTKNIEIDAIVMPYVYSEKSLAPIKFLLKKKKIPKVFNFHHEEICAPFREHSLLPRDEISKNKVIHFVWANYFKEKLLKAGVKEDKIYVTGNIRAEKNFHSDDRDHIAKKYGLNVNKEWLMICESGNYTFSRANINHLVNERGYQTADLIEWNEYTKNSIAKMENQLKSLPHTFFDKYEIIYRDHPGIEKKILYDKRIKMIDDESISYWLKHLSCILTRMSTILFEAEKVGTPAIRYDTEDIPKKLIVAGTDKFPYIQNINDICEKIRNIHNSPKTNNFENYLGYFNDNPVDKIIEAINNELKPNKTSEVIELKDDYMIWPRLICNYFAPLILKYGVKWNCKLCSSFTNIKRDGPPDWRISYEK
jgi:hypothetical protein